MDLEELKVIVDFTIADLRNYENPKDVPVLINLSEHSIGATASSRIKYIGMGIDWEHGQLRIEPSENLVRKGNSLVNAKSVICKEFEGRKYYICPRCEGKVSKNDKYCRYCSQKLK